ncbi:MAG: aminotransferase class V-fold PLP-dependent enzyme [bacterium]|nr:aminotransferase class V-fold PLP-dependent enzyme [bacterium]
MSNKIIYLNNAAGSWPKPDQVIDRMVWAATEFPSTPGRGGSGVRSEKVLFDTRESLASLIGAADSSRIIFTPNTTAALNLAIAGLVRSRDHVVTTSMDHNSVARPLARLEDREGVEVTRVQAGTDGTVTVSAILEAVRPETALVVMTHASNVTGTIQPVSEVGPALRAMGEGRPLLLADAAQTVGVLPVDVTRDGIDLLAAPGHKALYGSSGTGFLYVGPDVELEPIVEGGTGGHSSLRRQPEMLPARLESGTPNIPGIAALGAAVEFITGKGLDTIRQHEARLMRVLIDGLSPIPGAHLFGPCDPVRQLAVLSFRLDDVDPAEVATFLAEVKGIHVRVGLHCSPFSHKTMGTWPEGTVRVSPGVFNTEEDVQALVEGVTQLQGMRGA